MASYDDKAPPDHRLRLFLSADIAGSTAFKAGAGAAYTKDSPSEPLWVQATRDFYLKFPSFIQTNYDVGQRKDLTERFPRVWKTIGDEIVFCCKIVDKQHLAICMISFLNSLRDFGNRLDAQNIYLDVKGTAWTAAFPYPNFTVVLDGENYTADQFDETFEQTADEDPRKVDFLGHGIDCGFRISSHSTVDRCALSLELAYLLADVIEKRISNHPPFIHYEKISLKGILKGRPYPIFYIETERNHDRRQMGNFEQEITGAQKPKPYQVRAFLKHFMDDAKIELPALPEEQNGPVNLPQSYETFRQAWISDAEGNKRRLEIEASGEMIENSTGNDEMPDAVEEFKDNLQVTPAQSPDEPV